MIHDCRLGCSRLAAIVCGLALGGSAVGPAEAQVGVGNRAVPAPIYYTAKSAMYDGYFADALREFQSESRSAIKTAQSSWIDSICYRAMIGECYYHMGRYPQAIENYNAALRLALQYSDWMIQVEFPPTVSADRNSGRRTIPWGASQRQITLGRISDTMLIRQGRVNNNDVVARGGVVQQAMLFPINAGEIVRCTALALRRRNEIMGPVCKYDPLTGQLAAALARRPAPPNHWSQSWVDLQLGLANAGAGQLVQAQQNLQRAITVGGQFDHPLTCVALLELGRLALEAGNLDLAGRSFAEASYSALYYDQIDVLEEAFRLGFQVHLMANRPGLFPPLQGAADWARSKRLRRFEVWLAALAAENQALLGQSRAAQATLGGARGRVGRRDMAEGVLGAQLNYLAALVATQMNQTAAADESLAAALAFQRQGSKWVYQISLVDHLFSTGTITSRIAVALYEQLLRDPLASDWSSEPLEALSVLSIPHEGSYESWFAAALDRKDADLAIKVSDLARRHRFLSALPLGGRLLSLRTLLKTPADQLDKAAAVQRQDLLLRYPRYEQLAQQAQQKLTELAREPLIPVDERAARRQTEALAFVEQISIAQEGILREMALRREPADILFPPVRPLNQIQAALSENEAVLTFFATPSSIYGFLVTNDQYAQWRIGSPAVVRQGVDRLLRDLGNFGPNQELNLDQLRSGEWRATSAKLMEFLFRDSKVDLSQGIDELVIVPDGVLWYVPFAALPVGPGAVASPLLSRMRLRYAPTLGLSVPGAQPARPVSKIGVTVGKLFPRDSEEVAAAAFARLHRSVPSAIELPLPLPAAPGVYVALLDGLVVLNDLAIEATAPFGWAPLPSQRKSADAALATWFRLPARGPSLMILPGYHTAAETALRQKLPPVPGREVFLSVCGLMSTGARTVVISRWRSGGETSFQLVREFCQELPHTSAADAWQRSVSLLKSQPIDWESEPRLERFEADAKATADHPFFWSGFMMIDTGQSPPSPADGQPVIPLQDGRN